MQEQKEYYRGIRIYKQIEHDNVTEAEISEATTITNKIVFLWKTVKSFEQYPHDDFSSYGPTTIVYFYDGLDSKCILEDFESFLKKYEKWLNSNDFFIINPNN